MIQSNRDPLANFRAGIGTIVIPSVLVMEKGADVVLASLRAEIPWATAHALTISCVEGTQAQATRLGMPWIEPHPGYSP